MKTIGLKFTMVFVGVGLFHKMLYFILAPTVNTGVMVPSYAIQGAYGLLVLSLLFITVKRYPNALAFVFMGLSVLKILLFFLLFLPILKVDGVITSIEKIDVLIPYLTALILETFFGVKKLNKL